MEQIEQAWNNRNIKWYESHGNPCVFKRPTVLEIFFFLQKPEGPLMETTGGQVFLQRLAYPSPISSLVPRFIVNWEECVNHGDPKQRGVFLWGQAPLLSWAATWEQPTAYMMSSPFKLWDDSPRGQNGTHFPVSFADCPSGTGWSHTLITLIISKP